jgi:hypothetical protein
MCSVATLAGNHHGYAFDCGPEDLVQSSNRNILVTTAEQWQLLAHYGFQQPPDTYVSLTEQTVRACQQHGIATIAPIRIHPKAAYDLGQTHTLPVSRRTFQVASFSGSCHKGLQAQLVSQQQQHEPEQNYQQRHREWQSSARKTTCTSLVHDHTATHQIHAPCPSTGVCEPVPMTPHSQNTLLRPQAYTYSSDLPATHSEFCRPGLLAQAHHHHRLPNHHPPSTAYGTNSSDNIYTAEKHGSQSVVGQPGMPKPAAKPKVPKLKFKPEEDALLVELKETKNLTWNQIADFFPGRSSGTLQVRYCTKLKATAMVWTEDKVDRYRARW